MRNFYGIFEGSEDFDSIYRIGVLMQSLWENYRPVCPDLSQLFSERLYFTESIFLNGILV